MKDYLDRVTEDSETLLITRKEGYNVVAQTEESYESGQELLYLLGSFRFQQRLAESLQQLAAGNSRVQSLSGSSRPVAFSENAWQDYQAWEGEDVKTRKKIDAMLREIAAGGGRTGRPRPLQGDLNGCWSRRINDRDRLVYRVDPEAICVLACRYA